MVDLGWIVRIHHNFTSDDEKLLDTFDAYENVDICNTTDIIQDPFKFNSNLFAKTWRWVMDIIIICELICTFKNNDGPLLCI